MSLSWSCKHQFKFLSLRMLDPWIFIRLPTWAELSTCVFARLKIYVFTGMKKYLFASFLKPHEFLIFNFQTFMEEILQLHIFADNAFSLFALKDVWLLLELKILWSSNKSAFCFFYPCIHPNIRGELGLYLSSTLMWLFSNTFSWKKYQTWVFTNSSPSKKVTKISFYVYTCFSSLLKETRKETILTNVCLSFT